MNEYIAEFTQSDDGVIVKPIQELVRCRDCRYFGSKVRIGNTFVCNKHGIYVPENGYCSEGKTK